MNKLALIALATVVSLTIVGFRGVTASAAPKNDPKAPVKQVTHGYDVSYPQCGKVLPSGQAFGIVGVNGGLATTENDCLVEQLGWAAKSTGVVASQPKIQLYVNTANPGEIIDEVSTWPTQGLTPYGFCDGANDSACSWQYGYERAQNDLKIFTSAASEASISANPADYRWWLDVETENTWQSGSAEAFARNRAALEGMKRSFSEASITSVGIYSTNYQWQLIAGSPGDYGTLNGSPSWMAGARTARAATDNCKNKPFVPGAPVILSQYVSAGLDYDVSCG